MSERHPHAPAVCTQCEAELVIVCSADASHSGIEYFRDPAHKARIAPAPTKPERPRAKRKGPQPVPSHCTYGSCSRPVVARKPGARGRPPTRCEVHYNISHRTKAGAP